MHGLVLRGESFYNPMLKAVVDDLTQKKMVDLENGASCVPLEGFTNREGNPARRPRAPDHVANLALGCSPPNPGF